MSSPKSVFKKGTALFFLKGKDRFQGQQRHGGGKAWLEKIQNGIGWEHYDFSMAGSCHPKVLLMDKNYSGEIL